MPDSGDLALACMRLFVDELSRAGVRHVCVSPGSRSTPLALAVARHPRLQVHVHLDERSSSYFATGIARASGEPVATVCSSGTAAANQMPAVIEASMSRLPLIVLTADRPPELRDSGANQTIDQQRLFGGFVRWFVDAGVAEEAPGAARYWRSLGARAVATAMAAAPRPVHVNLPFREPLTPGGAALLLDDDGGRPDGAPGHRVVRGERAPAAAELRALQGALDGRERVTVVAGTLRTPAPSVLQLCAARGWPLLAEPTSRLRVPPYACAAGELLAADPAFRAAHRADAVLQLGAAPTTRAMQAFVRDAAGLVVVDPDAIAADPDRAAALVLRCDAEPLAAALLADERASPADDVWRRGWSDADSAVRRAVDHLLDSRDEPFEGRVARDVAAAAPEDSTVFAGSSMPVRDLAAFMAPRRDLRVLANRGASGIDGSVSSALGINASGQRVTALIGDLALLHDASALLWSAGRGRDAVFVVVDNDGGGIFSLLPQASLDPAEFERLFITPHGGGLDIAALARAADAGYREVTRASQLDGALHEAHAAAGVQLVHVRVHRDRAAELRAEVRRRVSAVDYA